MVYRVYHQYKKHGLDCIQTKKRVSTKMNYGPYVTTSIKKYPQLLSDIQAMVSVPPQNKSKWTIESITTELHKINYKISTTSVAKLIKHHQIKY
jgi:transposase